MAEAANIDGLAFERPRAMLGPDSSATHIAKLLVVDVRESIAGSCQIFMDEPLSQALQIDSE